MQTTTSPRPRRGHRKLFVGVALVLAVTGALTAQRVLAPSWSPWEALRGQPTAADGAIPAGLRLSVHDEASPAVARLDEDLLAALREAAADATADGVQLLVSSGWRSAAYQDRLLRDAVDTYGSRSEALRWVATAATSAHVSGDAVDIGPYDSSDWLVRHGEDYGLCQIYGNEPWHFELRPGTTTEGCPPRYANPAEDPRMQL
ncbi:hypothetical protein GCM10027271_44750 [Saccharopolyspora gloriosae]|uniref:D-alanyl-D-alanine carboxypeptidase-like core domain-containing protein n=1 Tax=Saccharopolyspora gloriosae TaxID=455344 RepID=A0A840ND34_9PSEU|nr:M15 family metallopeptidase [Saccharopolyspora gloriosae]MBB5070226.1 hypothetical protein [Saccharopolyspora gloriosae]